MPAIRTIPERDVYKQKQFDETVDGIRSISGQWLEITERARLLVRQWEDRDFATVADSANFKGNNSGMSIQQITDVIGVFNAIFGIADTRGNREKLNDVRT